MAANDKHIRLLAAILLSGVAFQTFTPIAPAWLQDTNIDSFNRKCQKTPRCFCRPTSLSITRTPSV